MTERSEGMPGARAPASRTAMGSRGRSPRAKMTGLPAAASTLVRDVLGRSPAPWRVVAAGAGAVTLAAGDEVVVLVAPGGSRLPIGVLVPVLPSPVDGPAVVGDEVVRLGGSCFAVRRWFDPVVRAGAPDAAATRRLGDHLAATGDPDPLLPGAAVDELAGDLLRAPDRLAARLVGRGSGSTPSGDDLLAAALATLRITGHPGADAVAAAVLPAATTTTTLSAALLRAADAGAVIPEIGAVLQALAAGIDPVPAADRLLAVGHRSGWHLAAGITAAVTAGSTAAMAGRPAVVPA